jgi:hypothetical protein
MYVHSLSQHGQQQLQGVLQQMQEQHRQQRHNYQQLQGPHGQPAAVPAVSSWLRGVVAGHYMYESGTMQQQQQLAELSLQPLSLSASTAAAEALAAHTIDPRYSVCSLLSHGAQLQTSQRDRDSVHLVSVDVGTALVSGFCPGFWEFMQLQEAATPLQDRALMDLAPGRWHAGRPGHWQEVLLGSMPFSQLDSTSGITAALRPVHVGWWRAAQGGARLEQQLLQLLTDEAANPSRSLSSFFWSALGLLKQHLLQGVSVPKSSNASAGDVLHDYVWGMAHVGRVLTHLQPAEHASSWGYAQPSW